MEQNIVEVSVNELETQIQKYQDQLANHSMYRKLVDLETLKVFMGHHIFAVWDFMSLLKGLQREITCVDVPWYPSPYSKKLVRLINEIVLGEESDVDHLGGVTDHFTLYLLAMKEVGMKTFEIEETLQKRSFENLRPAVSSFVNFNLELAHSGKAHLIAGAFFFGREKLIPDMFTGLLTNLRSQKNLYPALEYYLERHIHLDGGEHSHLAQDCLLELCGSDSVLYKEALMTGIRSLELRIKLWDDVEALISKN